MYKWFFGDSLSLFDAVILGVAATVLIDYGFVEFILTITGGSFISVILRRFA